MNRIVCGLFFVLFAGLAGAVTRLQERYNWRQLDWVFPNQAIRDRAIASGDYVPTNGLPVGIERWQNKLFVTVPRWRNGQWKIWKTNWKIEFVKKTTSSIRQTWLRNESATIGYQHRNYANKLATMQSDNSIYRLSIVNSAILNNLSKCKRRIMTLFKFFRSRHNCTVTSAHQQTIVNEHDYYYARSRPLDDVTKEK